MYGNIIILQKNEVIVQMLLMYRNVILVAPIQTIISKMVQDSIVWYSVVYVRNNAQQGVHYQELMNDIGQN